MKKYLYDIILSLNDKNKLIFNIKNNLFINFDKLKLIRIRNKSTQVFLDINTNIVYKLIYLCESNGDILNIDISLYKHVNNCLIKLYIIELYLQKFFNQKIIGYTFYNQKYYLVISQPYKEIMLSLDNNEFLKKIVYTFLIQCKYIFNISFVPQLIYTYNINNYLLDYSNEYLKYKKININTYNNINTNVYQFNSTYIKINGINIFNSTLSNLNIFLYDLDIILSNLYQKKYFNTIITNNNLYFK